MLELSWKHNIRQHSLMVFRILPEINLGNEFKITADICQYSFICKLFQIFSTGKRNIHEKYIYMPSNSKPTYLKYLLCIY